MAPKRSSSSRDPAASFSAEATHVGVVAEIERLVAGEHSDPHHVLGIHRVGSGFTVRAYRPGAQQMAMSVGREPGFTIPMIQVHEAGVFEGSIEAHEVPYYRILIGGQDGLTFELEDPYRFLPTLGELDTYLFSEGRHEQIFRFLGAHITDHQGVKGVAFAVWAPNALSVRVVGDFNSWDGRVHPMRVLGSSGVWELFIPDLQVGSRYKYEILTAERRIMLKSDPYAFSTEAPPQTASVIFETKHEWLDAQWIERRAAADPLNRPISIYECHIGSWRRNPEEQNRSLTYRELAIELPEYLNEMGFTHVELLPVAEHPFRGSWGYQVSAYYAPSRRFGSPDDFKYLIDKLHQAGIGVILDWVPAHFPRDEFALSRFDGTALYEHADPRQGSQPDWGTLVFNMGRNEVRNFLLGNALWWIEEFHADGLRVDAVASMLYLDYSRKPGEWVPNRYGGRENLESVSFLKEVNTIVYGKYPGVMMVAEESTSWPAVSRPTYVGGLGFGFKWNLGWMHDTLSYLSKDPVHRRFHHNNLTFGLLYAWHENFILPLSHDEVVHGKGSLLGKMPGDQWQKIANVKALFAWMWAHPGKQLLFMGGEFAQSAEWSHDRSLDWHLLDSPDHRGVSDLIKYMNSVYKQYPALWERDFDPQGFRWIDANDTDSNVLSFTRFDSASNQPLVCVANFSPIPRYGYRIGLPRGGSWHEVLNTDWEGFSGSGVCNPGDMDANGPGWHGLEFSADVTLPPLGVIWLVPSG